jgi:non-specific protein-tyrosine kinase
MEFKDYIAPILKWWWLIVAAVIVAAGVSLVVTQSQEPVFEAKTTLMIGRAIEDPNPSNLQFNLGQQLASTYADIARREPVQDATRQALGLENWLPRYIVRPIQNTQLIEIIVTDTNSQRAMAVANELGNQLILQSPTNPQQEEQDRLNFINSQLDELEIQIQQTQDEIAIKQEDLGNLVSAAQILETQNQVTALQAKLTTLQTNYTNLLANTQTGAINTLSVIERASIARRVGPSTAITMLTAAGIGLILSAGAAYLLEYLDNTVKSPSDINRLVKLPILAGIGQIKGEDPNSKLITVKQPRAPISEAYRKLRTGIQFASIDNPDHSTLLVTSSNPSEGKSVTAANLSAVMAQTGNRVLILDADLRRPTQHTLFSVSNGRGLTSLLLKIDGARSDEDLKSLIDQIVHQTPVKGLHVLTSGPIPPNPSELLGSSKMKLTLDALAQYYDIVVLDSPPVLAVTDAAVLSQMADNILLVAYAGQTQRSHLKQAVEQLQDIKANIVGIVLNRLSARGDGYYYYRNAYYYADGGDDGARTKPANGGLLKGLVQRNKSETIGE